MRHSYEEPDYDELERRFVALARFLVQEGFLSRSKITEITGFSQKELVFLFRLWDKDEG